MSKSAKTTHRREDAIAWVIFTLCAVVAFAGLATGHKEVIAIAFGALGVFLAGSMTLIAVEQHKMKARIRKASKRTAADMA